MDSDRIVEVFVEQRVSIEEQYLEAIVITGVALRGRVWKRLLSGVSCSFRLCCIALR